MLFRGIRNRVLVQFWMLFLVSMLLIDILVLLIFLDRSTSHFIDQKRFLLEAASQARLPIAESIGDSDHLREKQILPTGDHFLFIRQASPSADADSSDSEWLDLRRWSPRP